jgi:Flp pilus assembly protein TadB
VKFYKWKHAKIKSSSISKFINFIGLIFIIIFGIKFGGIGAVVVLFIIILILSLVNMNLKRLEKKLGITPEALKSALQTDAVEIKDNS